MRLKASRVVAHQKKAMVANTDYWYRCPLTPPTPTINSILFLLTIDILSYPALMLTYQKIASFRGSLGKHGNMEPCCSRCDGTGLQM